MVLVEECFLADSSKAGSICWPGIDCRYNKYKFVSPSSNKLDQSAYPLSLAQLEERKTVTATATTNRYLEARGSIPRGETLLALVGIYFWSGMVVVDVFDRNHIFGCK
jgi:hypothetical protein